MLISRQWMGSGTVRTCSAIPPTALRRAPHRSRSHGRLRHPEPIHCGQEYYLIISYRIILYLEETFLPVKEVQEKPSCRNCSNLKNQGTDILRYYASQTSKEKL